MKIGQNSLVRIVTIFVTTEPFHSAGSNSYILLKGLNPQNDPSIHAVRRVFTTINRSGPILSSHYNSILKNNILNVPCQFD